MSLTVRSSVELKHFSPGEYSVAFREGDMIGMRIVFFLALEAQNLIFPEDTRCSWGRVGMCLLGHTLNSTVVSL